MKVVAVSYNTSHSISKHNVAQISLLKGLGVKNDAHMGKTVKHRSRVAKDPTQPNLRQVHLIHSELHRELNTKGFCVQPGAMGENITTEGISLLELPKGSKLLIGETAVIEVTGLRNPCKQLEQLQEGLMQAVLEKDENGNLIRKSGIMAIVVEGGVVKPDDIIKIEYPTKPYVPLEVV